MRRRGRMREKREGKDKMKGKRRRKGKEEQEIKKHEREEEKINSFRCQNLLAVVLILRTTVYELWQHVTRLLT